MTASNFGQLASGQSTTPYSVTVTGNSAGALTGQTIHVASNFDNVTGPTLTLTGGAAYNLAQATVSPSPTVNLGPVHVNGTLAGSLSISNSAPVNATYTETLGAGLAASPNSSTGAASISGSFTGLAAGAAPSTAVTVSLNTTNAGNLSGTATVGLVSQAVNGSGLGTTVLTSKTVNVTGTAWNLASGSLGTINIGNVLVGSVINPTLLVTNTGPAGAFTEGLDASVAGYSGGNAGSLLTSTNSFTSANTIAVGSSGNLTFSLNTTSAGTLSGNVLVNLASDGFGTSGLGISSLGEQSAASRGMIILVAIVGNLAAASSATPNPVTHNARLNAALPTQALTISNTATGPAEGLNASIGTASPGLSATGSFASLAAGSTNSTSLVVGLSSTATAGAHNGTATITLASDGTFNSGVTTPLPSQTITVNGAVYQPAVATTLATNLGLGNARIGGTLGQALSIGNVAPGTGGYTETLGGSVTGTTGSATTSGGPISVASGAAASTAISVGLSTGTAGAVTGSATLGFTTNAINSSGLGTASAGSQTVNLSGAVYQPAVASTLSTPINLGTVRSGTVVNTALSISNVAPTSAGPTYTETLGASFGATSAGLSGTGSVTGQVAGAAANTGMSVSFTAGAAGAYSGSAAVNFQTQAVNGSGLGVLALTSQAQTEAFNATVNAIANGVVSTLSGSAGFVTTANAGTLNFGTITIGSGTQQENLALQNLIAGLGLNPADFLTGSYDTSLVGSPFGFVGSTSIGDLAANTAAASDFDITFNTSALGTFSATLTIDEASHNAFQSDLTLTPYVLTIDGTVAPVSQGGGGVPDSGTTGLFLGLSLVALTFLGRRSRRTV